MRIANLESVDNNQSKSTLVVNIYMYVNILYIYFSSHQQTEVHILKAFYKDGTTTCSYLSYFATLTKNSYILYLFDVFKKKEEEAFCESTWAEKAK